MSSSNMSNTSSNIEHRSSLQKVLKKLQVRNAEIIISRMGKITYDKGIRIVMRHFAYLT